MPDENKILTALGLDTSQFESGVGRAASSVSQFSQALNSVDSELRRIPIVGDIYVATFGKIIDGFAQTRTEARQFASIMHDQVGPGLDEAMAKLEKTDELLAGLKIDNLGRKFSDFFRNIVATKGKSLLLGSLIGGSGYLSGSVEEKRAKEINELEKERDDLLKSIVERHKLEESARSEVYSKSILINEQAKIELDYSKRVAAANHEAYTAGGPDLAKWQTQIIANLQRELILAGQIRDAERAAAQRRADARRYDNAAIVASAVVAVTGNSRDAAEVQVRLAERRLELARESTSEEYERARAELKAANIAKIGSEIEYRYAQRQLDLENELEDLTVRGQTRAANQAKIRVDYELRIDEAMRRGNDELADRLKKQQQSKILAESIREYELGAGGRARERQEERRKAQVARIIEARNRNKEHEAELRKHPDLHPTHLYRGPLALANVMRGSLLDVKPKAHQKAEAALSETQKFQKDISGMISRIEAELSG